MKWLVLLLVAPLLVLLWLYYDEFGLPSRVGNAISDGRATIDSIQATRTANAEIRQDEHERAILAAVNQERGARGRGRLEWDARLQAIARAHSQDMAEHDYLEHTNKSGQDYRQRAIAAGYHCPNPVWQGVAENLYFGTVGHQSPESPAKWWMNSPGHRAAMLDPSFHRGAIGVHRGNLSGYGSGQFTTLLLC